MATAIKPESHRAKSTPAPDPATTPTGIHWSMRLMSLVSLLALGVYTYVLWLCRRARHNRSQPVSLRQERRRVRLSTLAFALDLTVSAYFSAATPLLLKKGGLPFDRKNLPRPMFWFFAVTGFVPTASMTLTVVGGVKWSERIRGNPNWRRFHGLVALLAYFSWWVACSPVLLMGLLGEKRTIELLKKSGWLKA